MNAPTVKRGFAAMDPKKQRELASQGGRAAHAMGRGREWTSEQAREAGRKGGKASRGGRGKTYPPNESGLHLYEVEDDRGCTRWYSAKSLEGAMEFVAVQMLVVTKTREIGEDEARTIPVAKNELDDDVEGGWTDLWAAHNAAKKATFLCKDES